MIPIQGIAQDLYSSAQAAVAEPVHFYAAAATGSARSTD